MCFDPRSRTGSESCAAACRSSSVFRSTLPHGERLRRQASCPSSSAFRSTLPHGERQWSSACSPTNRKFRSTLPHGERPKRPVGPPICLRFDPRSRTGSDASSVRGVARHRVSIHAPARGATPAPAGDSPAWLFRSTLPHGERASTDRIPGVQRRFDPRSRTGSDAPTSAGRRRWPRFDPRSRTGSDPRFNRGCTVTEFRSTLPHGERSVRSTIPGP